MLTKRDLVDEDLLELAQLEIAEELEGTAFADSEMVAVSSTTGEGIPELRSRLIELAREIDGGGELRRSVPPPYRPGRSSCAALGAIVTGTLISGRGRGGADLERSAARGERPGAEPRGPRREPQERPRPASGPPSR